MQRTPPYIILKYHQIEAFSDIVLSKLKTKRQPPLHKLKRKQRKIRGNAILLSIIQLIQIILAGVFRTSNHEQAKFYIKFCYFLPFEGNFFSKLFFNAPHLCHPGNKIQKY